MLILRTYMFVKLVAGRSVYHKASARMLALGHNSDFDITPVVMLKGLLATDPPVIAFLFVGLVVTFAYAAFALESVVTQEPPTTGVKGFLDCFWMTLVTMTTVGYGDLVPHTYGGRAVMAITSLVSMAFFGVIVNQVCVALEPGRFQSKLASLIRCQEAKHNMAYQGAVLMQAAAKRWLHHKRSQKDPSKTNPAEAQKLEFQVLNSARLAREARKSFREEHNSVEEDVPVMCAHILTNIEEVCDKVIGGQANTRSTILEGQTAQREFILKGQTAQRDFILKGQAAQRESNAKEFREMHRELTESIKTLVESQNQIVARLDAQGAALVKLARQPG